MLERALLRFRLRARGAAHAAVDALVLVSFGFISIAFPLTFFKFMLLRLQRLLFPFQFRKLSIQQLLLRLTVRFFLVLNVASVPLDVFLLRENNIGSARVRRKRDHDAAKHERDDQVEQRVVALLI